MATMTKSRRTASLDRFIRQESLIRDAMEGGINRGLDSPDDNDPDWEEQVRYQIEVACIRTVDSFLSYISETLQLAMAKQPAMLRSSETITVDEVMRFTRHADLISFLTDRTITQLSYKSFSEVEKYIRDKINIDIAKSDADQVFLKTAIELRNIYSHNRGEASATTMRRLEQFEHPLKVVQGKLVETSIEALEEMLNSIGKIARRVDEQFARKFKLVRTV